jgi:hypothetical protein
MLAIRDWAMHSSCDESKRETLKGADTTFDRA